MPRRFTAASSEMIRSATSTFAGTQTLAGSIFAVLKKNSDGAYENILYGGASGSGTERWTFEISSGNLVEIYDGSATTSDSSFTVTTSDGWVLIGYTKATGTATPVFHKYVFSTGTWTHSNGSNSIGNGTAGAFLQAGLIRTVDPADFDLACVGVWQGTALTNAQVETLAGGFSAWLDMAPGMLWVLDQSSTTMTVRDWVGVTHEASKTGTSVSTSSSPIGYGAPILDTSTVSAGAAATNANAGNAAGTGTAYNGTVTVAQPAGNAAGTGTASNATGKVNQPAGNAAATGTASNPGTSVSQPAGVTSATGTASNASQSVAQPAGNAPGTGTAYDATVNTSAATNANAGNAAGTGTASNPSQTVSQPAGSSSGTGTASAPTGNVNQPATVAAATGTARAPTVNVNQPAGNAAATGTAYNPTVSTSSSGSASAQVASGTGTASNPGTSVAQPAGNAAGTGTANGATVTVAVNASAGVATVTATALGPSIAIAVSAARAAATATANDPTIQAGVIEVVVYDVSGQIVYQASHAREVFTAEGDAVFGATGRLVSGRGYP